jgi:hypothetical protein
MKHGHKRGGNFLSHINQIIIIIKKLKIKKKNLRFPFHSGRSKLSSKAHKEKIKNKGNKFKEKETKQSKWRHDF